MKLNSLQADQSRKSQKKRVGRGNGSNWGKTCGRGQKGQNSRSGGGVPIGFEGGQNPLYRRLPKVGFSSPKQKFSQEISVEKINHFIYSTGIESISIESLKKARLIKNYITRVKIISGEEVSKKIIFGKNISASASAKQFILEKGGVIEVL